MTDPPPEACEVCGEGPVSVVLYPVAVHFKGSGFYSTDYGRGARKEDAGSRDGDSAASDGAKKEKSGETKEKSGETKTETGSS